MNAGWEDVLGGRRVGSICAIHFGTKDPEDAVGGSINPRVHFI